MTPPDDPQAYGGAADGGAVDGGAADRLVAR